MLDHERDLDADFLRFYGLDIRRVDGPRLLALAHRVGVYGGVMTMRYSEATGATASAARPQAPDDDTRWVRDDLIHLDPVAAGLFERVSV